MSERVWVKICGLTTSEGVRAAVEAGADAIGFVFASSKRQVTPSQAAALAGQAPATVMRVAVMLHPRQSLVDEVCEVLRPDVLQTDAEDLDAVRVPHEVHVLPVVRAGKSRSPPDRGGSLAAALSEQPPRVQFSQNRSSPARAEQTRPAVLFEGLVSGAGETSDWELAAQLARTTQLVLAGGLNAHNVREAISRVRPFGVDVSSGVESTPGVKDPQKIHEFVRMARAGASR